MPEAQITINGKPLNVGQAMTIRVAIESMVHDMNEIGCGDDEHGRFMTAAYLERIREIRELLKT